MTYVGQVNEVFDASMLAAQLPGTWTVAASNFPRWLDGKRHNPEFSYDTVEGKELMLRDTVRYATTDGTPKTIVGTDRLRGDEFVWRGHGVLKILASRWQVAGANEAFTIAVIRFSRSRLSPAGIDVLVRKDAPVTSVRSEVAHATEQFGLTAEEFASLTWLF
ncbi:hypothetical protein FB472_2732 [Rhodoglobus vestalii]|uniref:Uncharacterized protein n=1 Tax=Rhodoglobus vestalii TaxID=193384 RepID=A0A8H2K8X5_9MICO|nr:hypothetical protein FB472_2732 [Rhodoglobus vestalii]